MNTLPQLKDIFDKLGLKVPTTYGEMLQAAAVIKAKGRNVAERAELSVFRCRHLFRRHPDIGVGNSHFLQQKMHAHGAPGLDVVEFVHRDVLRRLESLGGVLWQSYDDFLSPAAHFVDMGQHVGRVLEHPVGARPFKLVRAIAARKKSDAKRPGPLWNRRSTFVIDTDRTLLAEISSETKMEVHADEALEVLGRRSSGNRTG